MIELTPAQQKAVDLSVSRLHAGIELTTVFGTAGTGKALTHGSAVQTPSGPRAIETLQSGDEVFGVDGKATRVNGVYPQGRMIAYRVTFRDGFSVCCSDDHLWTVWTNKLWHLGRDPLILTTKELLDRRLLDGSRDMKFRIPLTRPLQYAEAKLPVDPYILGALIGDGTGLGRSVILCIPEFDQFIVEEVRRRAPEWIDIHSRVTEHCNYHHLIDNRTYRSNEMRNSLRELGLAVTSPERFVPDSYLRGSESQRRDLLAGLMDTDGTCRNNRTGFSTMSPRLASDISSLVQSLGGVAVVHQADRGQKGVEFTVNVKMFECPFLLPRKADQWRPTNKNPPSRCIASIEREDYALHTCISVDSDDGLFLADHHIVTHNSTVASRVAERISGPVAFVAPTNKAALVLRKKGVPAGTVHSLIYHTVSGSQKQLETLQEKLKNARSEKTKAVLRDQIAQLLEIINSPKFYLKEKLDDKYAAIVLDEASMVSGQLLEDLMSFGVPVLALGDPAQLPPVRATSPLSSEGYRPTIMLEQGHRFAEQSAINYFANQVRERGPRGVDTWRDGSGLNLVNSFTLGIEGIEKLLEYDQVICGRNATRMSLNASMRAVLGFPADELDDTDRMVALRNEPKWNLVNGEQYTVDELVRENRVPETSLMQLEGFAQVPLLGFAYAITAHKSQGSEWGRVVIFDESAMFGRDASRWLYTAITRAAEEAVVLRMKR